MYLAGNFPQHRVKLDIGMQMNPSQCMKTQCFFCKRRNNVENKAYKKKKKITEDKTN